MNSHLFDTLIEDHNIKNDAALALRIPLTRPQLSHMRAERMPVGPKPMINIHIEFGMSIAEIKRLLALPENARA